jgi:hypothetical protein
MALGLRVHSSTGSENHCSAALAVVIAHSRTVNNLAAMQQLAAVKPCTLKQALQDMGSYLGFSHIWAMLVIDDAPVAEVAGSTVAVPASVKECSNAATRFGLVQYGGLSLVDIRTVTVRYYRQKAFVLPVVRYQADLS